MSLETTLKPLAENFETLDEYFKHLGAYNQKKWEAEEEEERRRNSIFTKFKPLLTVVEQPSMEIVSRLATGEYIAWKKGDDSDYTEVCVQASSVDDEHLEFECPFCIQRYNGNGTRKRKPVHRSHVHGSLGSRKQRVEDRWPHCVNLDHASRYGFKIYITKNTAGSSE